MGVPNLLPRGESRLSTGKNILWDSVATPVHPLMADSWEFAMMSTTALVLCLTTATLANVVCLFGYF